MPASFSRQHNSVELEILAREDSSSQDYRDEPDLPLPLHSMDRPLSQQPRWLSHRSSKWHELLQWTLALIRPRPTWRYILATSVTLYISYCIIRRSPLLASNLPQYTGPHRVGVVDLEVPLAQPRVLSNTTLKSDGTPAYKLENVLFSLYYPADRQPRSTEHYYWIPKPISLRAKGYARLAHLDNFIGRPVFTLFLWALAGSIRIPAMVDVPLLGSDTEKSGPSFPVIVFSHGDISSRTDYSALAGELASRGYVVAVLEHRDGSGAATIVRYPDGTERRIYRYRESELLSDPPMNRPLYKREQLAFRQAEIYETFGVLRRLNDGKGEEVHKQNLQGRGGFLDGWTNRLDFTQLVIAGHSYGATGALQALKDAPSSRTEAVVGGIVLDPGKSSGPLNDDIDVPILVVHSNSWSRDHSIFHGRPHFDTVLDLVKSIKKRVGASWFMTSLGTSHPSVTDAPLIEPLLLSWTTGATINVNEGLREYVRVSDEFMRYLADGSRTGLLAQNVTHVAYDKDERTREEKKRTPKEISKYWQIHVAPEMKGE